jgi:hypothetical protein
MEWYSENQEFQICLVFRILLLPTDVLSKTVSAVLSLCKIP